MTGLVPATAALEGEVQAPGTVGTCRIAVWKAGGWYRWECTSSGHTGNGTHTTEARRDEGLAEHARQVAAADAATWVTVDAEPCAATVPEHSGCVVFVDAIPARCERRVHPPGTPHEALGLAWDGDDYLSLRRAGDCCPLHADGGCRAPDACCDACPDRTRP